MTPKEKARELVNRYRCNYQIICKMNTRNMYLSEAKQCALIAIDELIKETSFEVPNIRQRYWQGVKKEIEKL